MSLTKEEAIKLTICNVLTGVQNEPEEQTKLKNKEGKTGKEMRFHTKFTNGPFVEVPVTLDAS